MCKLFTLVVLCALSVGCQHYKILDLTTGSAYFTRDGCTQYKETGAIQFKDGATGDIITLHSSTRRTNITKQEYLAALDQAKQPAAAKCSARYGVGMKCKMMCKMKRKKMCQMMRLQPPVELEFQPADDTDKPAEEASP